MHVVLQNNYIFQVVWAKDLPDGELNFYSISEDGTVCNWLLMQSEMSKTIIVTLVLDIEPQITLCGISETLIGKFIILLIRKVF